MRQKETDGLDVVCIGLSTVDVLVSGVTQYWQQNDSTRVDAIDSACGGDALNEALVLKGLGAKVGLVARIGDDIFGKRVLQRLSEAGIGADGVSVSDKAGTAVSVVMIKDNGERNFLYYPGTNDELSAHHIEQAMLNGAQSVSIASLFELPGILPEDLAGLLSYAKAKGKTVFADMVRRPREVYERYGSCLRFVDYFFPNFDEAAELTRQSSCAEIARALLDAGVKNVVLKLGADGCYIRNADSHFWIKPARKVDPVDTTGAGDNFVAGFIWRVLNGCRLPECAEFANAVAALSIMQKGASAVVHSEREVRDYMARK